MPFKFAGSFRCRAGAGWPLCKQGGTMFEVGKSYTIKMWEDGEDGGMLIHYDECVVVEISMPLIKIKQPSNEEVIVNTASLAFVQATLETDMEFEAEDEAS
jgi:hypothetical protein